MKRFLTLLLSIITSVTLISAANTSNIIDDRHESNIQGHVIDSTSGEHVPFVNISIDGTTIGTTTDIEGHYVLIGVPAGKYTISATAVGYDTISKEIVAIKGEHLHVNFETKQSQISLDAVVVSSNRNESTRREAPTLVSIVDARLFENASAPTLADGLSFQSGLRVETTCQNCGFPQVRINGLEGHYSQILINSRPIFSALASVYGLEHIPANMIERVEVVRGGGSALYGASAIGGTINVITKEPLRNTGTLAHTLTATGCGSAYDNNTTLNASLVTDNRKAGMYVYAQNRNRKPYDHDGDGFVEIGEINSQTAGTQAYIKTGTYHKLTLDYHFTKEYRRGGDQLNRPPHEAMIAETTDHIINNGGLTFTGSSRDTRHHYSIYTSFQNINRDSYYGGHQDPNAYGKTHGLTVVGGGQYSYKFNKLWFMPAELTAGAEYCYDYINDYSIGYDIRTMQAINIYSVFLQNEWKNEKWGFLVGCRMDKHSMVNNAIFSPRVNFRYNPTKNINLRAVYSSGFRAPQAFDEDLHILIVGSERTRIRLADDLREERSHSFSLSADMYHNFGRVQTNLTVDAFYTILNDVFALRDYGHTGSAYFDPVDGARIYERYNASGATVMGINIEGRIAYSPFFSFQVGATAQRSRYKEPEQWSDTAPAVTQMFRSPNFYGYFTATVTPIRNFDIALTSNYTGPMLVQYAGVSGDEARMTKGFFDMGIKLCYDFKLYKHIGIEVNGGVRNIFNAYQNDFDQGPDRDSGYIYGPSLPRSWFVGAKISF